ncbi:MAG TPA: lactate racemase domain-containing protein [Actinomycetota bacterium]|nr:lactate racemase domain-containing protein [Actinomycetota bacterium]
MSRPGFVLEVDERTPPLLFHNGEGFRLERLPLGSRVVYPPESLPGIKDVDAAIDHALDHPQGSEPLTALLTRGMKLTIAIDDISIPLPQMKTPDIRGRILEHVLERAARAGVDDVEIIIATALHRRMTAAEVKRAVGERVYRSFWPHALYNFDAEDPDALIHVGKTEMGEDVEISKRAATSDLLVYVNINLVAMDGGHKSVPVGLASYKSLKHHHNVHTMLHSRSYMDPPASALHSSATRMGHLLAEHVKIFTIETTLNNDTFGPPFDFLMRREWEWSAKDQAAYLATKASTDRAPAHLKRSIFHKIYSPYGITGINAGETEAVHTRTLANLHRQQLVEVNGQSDILIAGLPFVGPYNVNSIMNPILVVCLGLGYFFNLYRNQPLVRPGGVMIMFHPVRREFHQVHHPSYVDFFEEVLAETTDPAVIESKYEESFATDPWYIHLYRTSHAYHGVHPFYMWYWASHAMQHLGDVIFVGGDRKTVARLGFRSAGTLADALEMASETVGRTPRITALKVPPLLLADVR